MAIFYALDLDGEESGVYKAPLSSDHKGLLVSLGRRLKTDPEKASDLLLLQHH